MGRDVALTLISWIAGLATSLGFYVLSTRHMRRTGWRLAKAQVIGDLAPSLGQSTVPSRAVILATIRSVAREHNLPSADLRCDDVIDELLRQVTADAFLETERRAALQAALVKLSQEPTDSTERVAGVNPIDALAVKFLSNLSYLHWTTFVGGVFLGLAVAIVIDPRARLFLLGPATRTVVDVIVDMLRGS